MKLLPGTLLGLFASVLPLTAQIGDKTGEAQTPIIPAERIPPSPALSPAEELKTFQVAPGFRVELVASEPLVGDPVAMTFGPDGRLWVVEMRNYMPDLDGNGEDQPLGRVVVLTDTDGDGRMDRSEVFVDKLIMPRAIALAHGGVLIGAPPMLWFCRDTDGDGRCEEKIEVANDYGVQVDPARPALANPERAPNSLLWAMDNWIYSGAYTAKFRQRGGKWERAVTTFRGQWGLSQDDWGHLFHNSNSDQLRADIVPTQYLGRNPHFLRPTGANVKVPADQLVWPIRVNPGINRGYRPEMLRDDKLKEFTAACAPWIYRGDLFPTGFYGNAFVCEPAGNLVKRNLLTAERGSITAREAYEQREFLASTDERFRPVNLTTGPDGALYIADFYRGVIQHRISLTTYLRQQSEARGLAQPTGLGRIWRVVPDGATQRVKPRFDQETPAQWVAHLSHPNAWWRETAQRLLVERHDVSVVPALESLAVSGPEPLGRLHALWTLDGLAAIGASTVTKALADPDPQVRAAAVRTGEALLATEARSALLEKWLALAGAEESPEVQLQLALSLGEARDPRADAALAALFRRAPDSVFLRDAILTGLSGRELELLATLLTASDWPVDWKPGEAFLGGLARCVLAEGRPARVERLLQLLADLRPDAAPRRLALVSALSVEAGATLKRPIKFPAEPPTLVHLRQALGSGKNVAFEKLATVFLWPGKLGVAPEVKVVPLTTDEQTRFDTGKQLYTGLCAACHQPHGLGMEGLAPPLADSEWVLGPPDRIARVILHGVRGPLKVKGATYNLDMPALGQVFDDQQIAAVLTYIRREWSHTASPVTPEVVAQIRGRFPGRQDAWTQEELLQVP